MLDRAPNINAYWSAMIVEELVRGGACVFCLSPGSRSAPLATAVAKNSVAHAIMHFDERGAAFHALGCAMATGRPAALICTSGTATANYWPAVVEAAQSHVPLILLTADRPPELLSCGANQAIDQVKLFGDYVRWRCDLPCPDPHVAPEIVLTAVDQALYRAQRAPAGPVHLNCMFREPLAPASDGVDLEAYAAGLRPWRESGLPYTRWEHGDPRLVEDAQDGLPETVENAQRGLLLVGLLRRPEEVSAVSALARALGWPVLPDIASGLRLGGKEANHIAFYDQLLLSKTFRERFRPDVVLHLGGPMVSKRLQQHLASVRPEYVRVAGHPERHDPLHHVTRRIETDVAALARRLAASAAGRHDTAWTALLERANRAVAGVMATWSATQGTMNEILAARVIGGLLPEGAALFCGNSMPIRDWDMFAPNDGAAARVFANRGASGIDGNIATASGIARALRQPLVAVIGDLAALHDLNSLALLENLAAPFLLVVINNDGGGIFSFLPVADYPDVFERFFAVPHGLRFRDAAALFRLGYCNPKTVRDFEAAFHAAFEADGAVLIEINAEREENAALHRELQAEIAATVERVCAAEA